MAKQKSKLWLERVTEANIKNKTTHGETAKRQRRPEYEAWRAMKKRCLLKTHHNYRDYGGRGIGVCDRWLGSDGFANFLKDLGRRPGPEYSLGRVNNDGNYEPGNCRWETRIEQCRNRRSCVRYEYDGQLLTIPEISEACGIPIHNLQNRIIKSGWSLQRATTEPVDERDSRKQWYKCRQCDLEWKLPMKYIQNVCILCKSTDIVKRRTGAKY